MFIHLLSDLLTFLLVFSVMITVIFSPEVLFYVFWIVCVALWHTLSA